MPQSVSDHPPVVTEGYVTSADGTRIAHRHIGAGPALVFVHGSVSTHTDWRGVARLLAPRYTCYAMVRRGRSHSGNGHSPYSLNREYEDVEAVLTMVENAHNGPITCLIGHSYGAICALGAALRHPVPRLVIYEPPLPVGGPIAGEYLAPYKRAIAQGDPDAALELGLLRFTRLSAEAIAAMRATKAWPRLRTLAPGWARELEAMDTLDPTVQRYAALDCPILMLVGNRSPEHPMQDASRALAEVLLNANTETMDGQAHMALRNAPQQVAKLIQNFLAS